MSCPAFKHRCDQSYLTEGSQRFVKWTHHVHVDAVGVGPRVLEVLLQPLSERVWDLVEPDELFHTEHLRVVPRRSRIQPLDDGGDVPKNAGVHQSWRGQRRTDES